EVAQGATEAVIQIPVLLVELLVVDRDIFGQAPARGTSKEALGFLEFSVVHILAGFPLPIYFFPSLHVRGDTLHHPVVSFAVSTLLLGLTEKLMGHLVVKCQDGLFGVAGPEKVGAPVSWVPKTS